MVIWYGVGGEEVVNNELKVNVAGSDGWIWLLNNVEGISAGSCHKHLVSLINVQSSDPILTKTLEIISRETSN